MIRKFFLIIRIYIILSGCSSSTPTPSEDDVAAAMAETAAAETANAPPTAEPTITPTQTITPTPDYYTRAFVTSPTLRLRSGPSTLFKILDTYQQGDEVYATGRVTEGNWVSVEAERRDGSRRTLSGWMFAEYLDLKKDINILPIIEFPEEQIIRGIVTDDNDTPINSIRVAAIYEPEGQEKTQADIYTGENGRFTMYVPEGMVSPLVIEIVHVACDSLIMDDDCKIREYFLVEKRIPISMPLSEEVHLVYEKGLVVLEGKVQYKDGWGVPGILVKGVRLEDGVEAEWVTEIGGRFYIPLGEGVWEIYAVRFERDGTPNLSDKTIYTITEETQPLEILIIPVP